MNWRLALVLPGALALAVGACDLRERPGGMDAGGPVVPSVLGYAEGEEILFMHTEASDAEIAETLTAMMKSPVLVVPALAQVPPAALANVYVFANGIQPRGDRGPLEYQPDVFDAPPGTPEYTPLRAVNLVTWATPEEGRLLTSAAEIQQAEAAGEVTIERPGVVVNMPFLTWPGRGER
ncbi:MAG TPA: hypothetical protein VMM12_09315 [Longimicrobiales bacterium]|nr:hypothetical protein [Longimicrobiales bacterium]